MPSFLQSIESKRDGHALSDDAIRDFVRGVVSDAADQRLPDYQVSAFLMAVFFRGLDDRERRTARLTAAAAARTTDATARARDWLARHGLAPA